MTSGPRREVSIHQNGSDARSKEKLDWRMFRRLYGRFAKSRSLRDPGIYGNCKRIARDSVELSCKSLLLWACGFRPKVFRNCFRT